MSTTLLRPFPREAEAEQGITAEMLASARALERQSRAENTTRSYGRAMAAFEDWCRDWQTSALPASEGTIKVYLHTRIKELDWRPSTVKAAFAGIVDAHKRAGYGNVVRDPTFRDFLRGVDNADLRRQRQARPFREVEMQVVRATAHAPRKVRGHWEAEQEARRRGALDVALLEVMRDALLRISEAAELRWGDIDFSPDGCGLLLVRRSKTDQAGEGRVKILPPRAVADLREIMGPVKPPDEQRVLGLSVSALGRRIRRICEDSDLGSGFSGHSCRVGMAQDLSAFGSEMSELMGSGGWKSAEMVYHYTRNQEAYRSAVAKYFGIDPESMGRLASQPRLEGL